jgi:WD40 repeat protein
VRTFAGATCRDIAASRDGTLLAWCDQPAESPRIRIARWQDESAEPRLLDAPPMLQGWHGLAFSPDGKNLIFVSESGQGVNWNIAGDRMDRAIGDDGRFQAPHIALSPDGRWLAGLHEQNAVSIWDAGTGDRLFAFRPERAAIWSLAWSTDSSGVLLGLNDGGLISWDLAAVHETLASFGHADVAGTGRE